MKEILEGTVVRLIGSSDIVNKCRQAIHLPRRDWSECMNKDLYILKQNGYQDTVRLYRLEGSEITVDGHKIGLWELLIPETAFTIQN